MLATLASGPAAAGPPLLLASPDEPGPNRPPAGRSLFDELFQTGGRYQIPYPFERLLDAVNARIAPAEATGVLIPLGRSLQRFAADPDYFASPRVVVAVTEDAGGPDRPLLADRLFLGFHERAEVIEVISYNEAAGRFEFQVVEDYGPGLEPRVHDGERSICTVCHQAHGPIFATALWSETNANPRIATRLAGLGTTFHGAPVQGGVDRADAVDRATDRAARLAFADWIWREGCASSAERGELLLAALRFRLSGSRALAADPRLAGRLATRLEILAPGGIGSPSPDLPNRDPLLEIEGGTPGYQAVEPDGPFDPSLARAPRLFWTPATQPDALLADVVRDLAATLSAQDVAQLDAALEARAATAAEALRASARCEARADPRGREIRLRCAGPVELTGHLTLEDGEPSGGVIRELRLDGRAAVHRLQIARIDRPGRDALSLVLRETSSGLAARLPDGERVRPLVLRMGDDGAASLEVTLVDDLGPLRGAITRMVKVAEVDPSAALGPGPLRRRAILAELAAAVRG